MISHQDNSGFMALITVVIIAAAALALTINSSFLGLAVLESADLNDRGAAAVALADGCLEEAFHRLRLDPAYPGAPVPGLTIGAGSCIIEVADLGGGVRRVSVRATVGDFTRRLTAIITLDLRSLAVNEWQAE